MLYQTLEVQEGKAPCPHRLAQDVYSEKSKAECDKDQESGTDENDSLSFFVRPRARAHLQNQINLLSIRFLNRV